MEKTILVVDDDKLITNTLNILMKASLKLKVITSNNPIDAVELYKNNKIDLVISDFMMPDMDGIQFLKEIKSVNPDAVTILLTGYSDKESAIKAINEIGIYHYIEKPWDNGSLINIVQNGLEKDELSRLLKNKVDEIQELYSLLEAEHKKVLNQNELLEQMVTEKTRSIRTLMDNAGQGFMYFGDDLLIRAEYSSECTRIFGSGLEGRNFADIIYPEDCREKQLYQFALLKILGSGETDGSMESIYIPLLPSEFQASGLTIHLEYKPLRNTTDNKNLMMVIVTDISQKKILEDEINRDRDKLAMIVNAVLNRRELLESISDYKAYCMSVAEEVLYNGCNISKAIVSIYRSLHNFKGVFSQLGLLNTTKRLHNLETELYRIKDSSGDRDLDELRDYVNNKAFISYINEDINILVSTLGNDFLADSDSIRLSPEKLNEIKAKVLSAVSPSKYPAIVNEFRELEMYSFKNMLKPLTHYTIELAGQLEKCVQPFDIEGEDFKADCKYYRPFVKSLVNVFRNMVFHGIELPEERQEAGKDEVGRVNCRIWKEQAEIIIEISDDGRGIDLDKLREVAVRKGYAGEEEISGWNDERVLGLICEDGVTVCEAVNIIAGRGEGMAEVKLQLDKIKGHMNILTKHNEGTTFRFGLPCQDETPQKPVCSNEIISGLMKTGSEFLQENNIAQVIGTEILEVQCLHTDLKRYTCFLQLRGAFSGYIAISVEQPLGERFIQYFLGGEGCMDADQEVYEDCIREFGNMTVGRSFEIVSCGEGLIIDDAFGLISSEACFKYSGSDTLKGVINTDSGSLDIVLFSKAF